MKRYREEYGGDRLQFNTIKLFMDGINQNRSSALLEPHTDDPAYVGDTTLSVEELRDFLLELSEEQFDIHIHTMGDLAVRRVLDAVEAAKDIAKNDFFPRVTIAHLGLIDSADLPRIKELGVIANYTPWWFTADQNDPLKVWLGDDRYANMYSPKALFDLGIDVTFSSDEWWGGDRLPTYLNPYFGMQVGHTRQAPKEWREKDDDAVRPPANAALSIEQLIAGYTRNGAFQLRMENQIGSIETGKLADLVILNDNLFEIDSDEIWMVKPAAVLMEGEVIQGALP
jgi:predicted amidohydrolase YtcJ